MICYANGLNPIEIIIIYWTHVYVFLNRHSLFRIFSLARFVGRDVGGLLEITKAIGERSEGISNG
jgi:hypothetical protein